MHDPRTAARAPQNRHSSHLIGRIDRPHPDIELGVARSPVEFLIFPPNAGLNPETGLILFFTGYGLDFAADSVLHLLSYLANKHNCVAASINYFGANLWDSDKCKWAPQRNPGTPNEDFFLNLGRHHGIHPNALTGLDPRAMALRLAELLAPQGLDRLHPSCLYIGTSPEYHSMGLLPALDGLQVTHRLINDFPLNKRRLFLLGSSYGGHIVNLMARLSPGTFRMVVDISGFSSAEDDLPNVFGRKYWVLPGDIPFAIPARMALAFSPDPNDANFFSAARREIRNLLNRDHVYPNTARHYGYHSVKDVMASTERKIRLRDAFAGKVPYELSIIDESQVDGKIFKELSHNMGASLRRVFDLSYDKFIRDGGALSDHTDFDLESSYVFSCEKEDYAVRFSRTNGVQMRLCQATAAQAGADRSRPPARDPVPVQQIAPPSATDVAERIDRSELRRIDHPHPDIELGVARTGLDYLICAPENGVDADTGLVLFFVGYGMEPTGRYVRSLLAHLANTHNCVAASVDYFGANLWESPKCRWVPHPEFFLKLKAHHGIEVNAPKGFDTLQLRRQLGAALRQRGVTKLNPACTFVGISTEYHSMGLLPALDGIGVAHRLIDEFALSKERLFAFGTSYGGYIASLVAKLAPQSFRMVVDNSGFSSAEDDIWNVYGQSKWCSPEGVAMDTVMVAAFSEDAGAANYFSPTHKEIRNLLNHDQVFEGSARIYGYHSIADELAPTAKKVGLRNAYLDKVPYELEIVDETTIDGKIFKDLSHGMRASMRGLFDRSYEKFLRDGGARSDLTDFELESRYIFPCGERDYFVTYSPRDGVRAQLLKVA